MSVKFAGISLANFNSHAHVERDFAFTHMHCHSFISTHTLTWSVTQGRERRIIMTKISTHTLTWSVTRYISHRGRQGDNFNSHAHVERDSVIVLATLFLGNFNSHAHVERDKQWKTKLEELKNFNSHAHVERDRRNAPLAHLR